MRSSLRLPGLGRGDVITETTSISPDPCCAESADEAKLNCCQVCHSQQSRYTCPKCHTCYCGVDCYKSHAERCTESFYQTKVGQVMRLHVQDRKEETYAMLDRVRLQYESQNETDFLSSDASMLTNASATTSLDRDDLIALLKELEQTDDVDRLVQSQPKHVRAAIQTALVSAQQQDSEQLGEWIVDPWHPYWRDQVMEPLASISEQMAKVPCFELLCKDPSPLLPLHLVDILYGITWIWRLYHGPENAKELSEECIEALLIACPVLSGSDSVALLGSLESVLSNCRKRSTKAVQTDDCNTPWEVLMQDVVLLCRSSMSCRALCEAMELLQMAPTGQKKQARRIRKKAEFFLSWCIAHDTVLLNLSSDITRWLETAARNPQQPKEAPRDSPRHPLIQEL